jgi:hypothetical protein
MSQVDAFKAYREKVLAGEIAPPERGEIKSPWQKLRENNTRKTAIDAMCCRCMGWDEHGSRPAGVIKEVEQCTDTGCPIYAWRPWK